MWHKSRLLMIAILIGLSGPALAAAPDLLPPISMQLDPGSSLIAQSLDFIDAPLSGAINFSPKNYEIHLGGDVVLPIQDVVPYFSIQQPLKDCQGVATASLEALMPQLNLLTQYIIPKVLGAVGLVPKNVIDPDQFFNGILQACNNDPKMADALMASGSLPRQIVADVRNSGSGATDIIFSGQLVDPVVEFPIVPKGYAGTVIGGGSTVTNDVWNDGVVVAGYEDAGFSATFQTPLMSSSLYFYRFLKDNQSQKDVLKFVGLSSGWLDKPVLTNGKVTNPCFKDNPNDPKNPFTMKTNAELLAAGCVGERYPVGMVSLNFYGHPNEKLKDLAVLSRGPMGDPKDPASKIGYLTFYKRTDKVPDDTSIFQDLWQFDESVTNAANGGIPEPLGIAVVRNWDPAAKKFTEGVVAGSNKLISGSRYYVYYYANDGVMKEPKAVLVGGVNVQGLPGFGGFGPYRVYSADVNNDQCGDILITRAKIAADGKTIAFADYFDVHLQDKMNTGECRGTFDKIGTKYQIAPIDPIDPKKPLPQISSLAIADFNKDGLIDVVAGDFTTYENKTTKIHENVVHFLENLGGGLFNTVQPPHFVATTKDLTSNFGVIDVKADAFANLGTVIAEPPAFGPDKTLMPNPCAIDPNTGKVDPEKIDPATCAICLPATDDDKDGFGDFPNNAIPVKVKTCINGNMNEVFMALDTTLFKYTPDCLNPLVFQIKTGRQWMHEWAGCDNCSASVGGVACNGPEAVAPAGANACWNKSQADKDGDGYGDVCTTKPSFMKECGVGAEIIFDDKWLTQVLDNDSDKDGIPDCVVFQFKQPTTSYCKAPCDNCSKYYAPDQATKDACTKDPSKCANPDQSETNDEFGQYGNACLPKPQNPSFDPPPLPSFKGHEVTVLLNKTNVKDVPPACQGNDLDCICQKTPDLLACKCWKDPAAPGCKVGPVGQVSCCLDVCRGDLTAPFPAMCDFIRPYNDEIRKITGLCMDVLVPVEGTQYHLSCTMPNAPALDLGAGKAYAQVFKSAGGQIPKNYFKDDWRLPVASQNLLKNTVLLNPLDDAATGGVQFDVSKLPTPDFSYDASLSAVAPNATVNQAPGITQIDGIMQIETYLADIDPATGAPVTKQLVNPNLGGVPQPASKALLLVIKGFSSPPGCQWAGSDCPDMMANSLPPRTYVDAIQAKVSEYEAAGKPITIDTINEAFKSMDTGPAFLHQEFVVVGNQGVNTYPVQNVMGGAFAEGGCGCTFSAASTGHNTLLPLLMAASALGGMIFLRRNSAKKR